MQLEAAARIQNRPRSFSILGRIGGDATCRNGQRCRVGLLFQYPRSDRRRCNFPEGSMYRWFTVSFQYPQSDRRRCNYYLPPQSRRRHRTFSILGRIGGDATQRFPGLFNRDFELSVSSVGSEAMQPAPRSSTMRTGTRLSVSSVGSEAMQQSGRQKAPTTRLVFQYPRSDRRRCNSAQGGVPQGVGVLSVSSVGSEAMQRRRDALPVLAVASFQYPRSDRRRCNRSTGQVDGGAPSPFSILGRIGGDATMPDCWP